MRRTDFLGATLLIAGVILFGFLKLAIANYLSDWNVGGTNAERSTAVRNTLMINFPYYFSIVMIILGLVLLFFHDVKKVWNNLFVDDEEGQKDSYIDKK